MKSLRTRSPRGRSRRFQMTRVTRIASTSISLWNPALCIVCVLSRRKLAGMAKTTRKSTVKPAMKQPRKPGMPVKAEGKAQTKPGKKGGGY